jgi:hypothetical protein
MAIFEVKGESELSVKRFGLPLEIDRVCPHCGANVKHDFGEMYLSYPILNKKETAYGYCTDCGENFSFDVTLKISLDVDDAIRK